MISGPSCSDMDDWPRAATTTVTLAAAVATRSTKPVFLVLLLLLLLFLTYCSGLMSHDSRRSQSYKYSSPHPHHLPRALPSSPSSSPSSTLSSSSKNKGSQQQSRPPAVQIPRKSLPWNSKQRQNSSRPKNKHRFNSRFRKKFKDLFTALVLNDQLHGRQGPIVILTDIDSRRCSKFKRNLCLYFNIRQSNVSNLTLSKAVLWLPRPSKKSLSLRQLNGRQSRKLRPLTPDRKNWVRFNILSFVKDWLSQDRQQQTQGVEILFRPHQKRLPRKEGASPFIVFNVRTRQKRRLTKRPPRRCSENDNGCCLANLTIRFADIGYNEFILNPSFIRVNYCKGECDLTQGFENGLNNVSIRQSLIRHSTNATLNKLIAPCCVPIQYDSHNIQYTIDGEIHKGTVKEMSIAECGCR